MKNKKLDLIDSIVILGYDLSKKEHKVIILDRIKRALSRFDKNIKKIILSGGVYNKFGFLRFRKKGITEARIMKKLILSFKKIKEDKLLLEESSKTTFSNILNSIRIMKKSGLKRALVIGDKKIKRKISIGFAKLVSRAKDIKLKID